MELKPYKEKMIRGRETKWFHVPPGFRLKQDPNRTHRIEAKIEQFSPTLWIFTLAAHLGNGGSSRHFSTYEAAVGFWKTWLERRTERGY